MFASPVTSLSCTCRAHAVTTYAEIKSGSCGTNGMRFLTTPDECKLAALTLGLPTSLTGDLLNPLTVDAVNPDRPQGCYVLYVEPNKVPRLNFATSEQTKGKGAEQSTKDRARHPICAIFGTYASPCRLRNAAAVWLCAHQLPLQLQSNCPNGGI